MLRAKKPRILPRGMRQPRRCLCSLDTSKTAWKAIKTLSRHQLVTSTCPVPRTPLRICCMCLQHLNSFNITLVGVIKFSFSMCYTNVYFTNRDIKSNIFIAIFFTKY
ncbi:hypothetical protein B566_EDAN010126 [Ephemera danica]|nr:hypothetical protein B566_EDAN010126 [Ephemera danica]